MANLAMERMKTLMGATATEERVEEVATTEKPKVEKSDDPVAARIMRVKEGKKFTASTVLTERQKKRIESISKKTGMSQSEIICELINVAFEACDSGSSGS